ncbi:MAG TPA: ATP-binding protein [Chloroflexia bacterium]|nr:ATP-binding protein [Chloroflexia bacterium]
MADRKQIRLKNEDLTGPVEGQAVPEAFFADLDNAKVTAYLAALDEVSDERSDTEDSAEERLETLGLLRLGPGAAQSLHPTVTAMLLFGQRPQRFLPQASVKLARFRGSDVDGLIVDRKEIFGTLDRLIEDTARFVTNNMRVQARIEGLYREDLPEYPLVAVREAVTNALAHRDYAITGQKVVVRMFDDRLEVESPGGLAGPVTLETLGQKRYSRNPLLTRLMYEMRLVEEMGTGIRRMRKALADIGSPPPSFISDQTSFVATIPALPLPEPEAIHQAAQSAPVIEPEAPVFEINENNRAEYFALLQTGLNERQARGLLYARERGRLTNRDYRAANPDITDETARLDLLVLVDKGYLMRIGDKKGASYLPR